MEIAPGVSHAAAALSHQLLTPRARRHAGVVDTHDVDELHKHALLATTSDPMLVGSDKFDHQFELAQWTSLQIDGVIQDIKVDPSTTSAQIAEDVAQAAPVPHSEILAGEVGLDLWSVNLDLLDLLATRESSQAAHIVIDAASHVDHSAEFRDTPPPEHRLDVVT